MSINYKLIKYHKFLGNEAYLFECEPQKRTISLMKYAGGGLCKSYKQKYISLDKHWFRISTFNSQIASAHMGEPHQHDYYKYLVKPYHFNGFLVGILCGHPPYENMHFTEKDFPKFLNMFWQSGFISYCELEEDHGTFFDFDFYITNLHNVVKRCI